MSVKTILVAHQDAAVRDRVAAALADAKHACVPAATADAARRAVADPSTAVSLALVDLSLAPDGVAFVRALREDAGRLIPIVVFAGSVPSASEAAALAAVPRLGLPERIGEPGGHSARARTAPVPGQLQPAGRKANHAGRARFGPGGTGDYGGHVPERRRGRPRRADHGPAPEGHGARTGFQAARSGGRREGLEPRRLERPKRGHGLEV